VIARLAATAYIERETAAGTAATAIRRKKRTDLTNSTKTDRSPAQI
jgi:hypothetical protein